jgi:hypothetical protein
VLAGATAAPLINMHMNMSPVAQEVEKLRLFIGNLTEQMINIMKVQERQIESQINKQPAADGQPSHEQQLNFVKELCHMFSGEDGQQRMQRQV